MKFEVYHTKGYGTTFEQGQEAKQPKIIEAENAKEAVRIFNRNMNNVMNNRNVLRVVEVGNANTN